MPEIIEVYKFAKFIEKFVGLKLSLTIHSGRYKTHGAFDNLDKIQTKLLSVKTKGKMTYMSFGDYYLVVTLGLTGGWVSKKDGKFYHPLATNSEINSGYAGMNSEYFKRVEKHIHVEFNFGVPEVLYFYDILNYGTMSVYNEEQMNKKLNSIGTDIITVSEADFLQMYRKKKNIDKEIAIVMMDQKTVSGIGNYLKSDILYLSSISPFRLTKNLTDDELLTICRNAKSYVLEELGLQSKTSKTSNRPIDFGREFFVYQQSTDIHGNEVTSTKQKDRTTFWVKAIQK